MVELPKFKISGCGEIDSRSWSISIKTRKHNVPHRGEYLGQTTLHDRTVQDLIGLYMTLQDFMGHYRILLNFNEFDLIELYLSLIHI